MQSPSLLETIRLCLHLALENLQGIKVKVVEIGDVTVHPESNLVAPLVTSVLGDLPLIQVDDLKPCRFAPFGNVTLAVVLG